MARGIYQHKKGVYKHSKKTKLKISLSNMGKKFSEKTRFLLSISHLGQKSWNKGNRKHNFCIDCKREIGAYRKAVRCVYCCRKGERNYWWKGGITSINRQIRQSLEYKLWRQLVFERDNFTCVWCKKRGGDLQADHIKSFSEFPELRFDVNNGRTLCVDCHKTTETYGVKKKNYMLNISV